MPSRAPEGPATASRVSAFVASPKTRRPRGTVNQMLMKRRASVRGRDRKFATGFKAAGSCNMMKEDDPGRIFIFYS